MSRNQSLIGHIQDLRSHVVRSAFWLMAFSCVAFFFMKPIVVYLKHPYEAFLATTTSPNILHNLTSISVFEVMVINFKVCFLVGFVLSLPFILGEAWKFTAPALYAREKKIVATALIASLFLFYAGLCFGFFLIIPYFFANALTWASNYAIVMLTYESYFNALITMMLIFAIIFEIPVILSLLGLAELLPSSMLVKNRKIVFLVCFILGAILAPPDVLSLCLVALPIYIMIEISIYIIKRIERGRSERPRSSL